VTLPTVAQLKTDFHTKHSGAIKINTLGKFLYRYLTPLLLFLLAKVKEAMT